MLKQLKIIHSEIIKILKTPQRLFGLFNSKSRQGYKNFIARKKLTKKYGEVWHADSMHKGIKLREYGSYENYINHQKSKLGLIDLSDYDLQYRKVLRGRLKKIDQLQQGMTALCLAARLGTEVMAFHDLGCFAVGIDLNPGPNNAYVLPGDFHNIQFPDHSVEVIFSNSLDHALLIDRLIEEIKRLLKPNGFLILEMMDGLAEGNHPDEFESSFWSDKENFLDLFKETGMFVVSRSAFNYPWEGEQILLINRTPVAM